MPYVCLHKTNIHTDKCLWTDWMERNFYCFPNQLSANLIRKTIEIRKSDWSGNFNRKWFTSLWWWLLFEFLKRFSWFYLFCHQEHLAECEYANIMCVNDCGAKFQRRFQQKHLDKDCPKKIISCAFCDSRFLREEKKVCGFPVSTLRRFNVVTTLLTSKQRCDNFETTLKRRRVPYTCWFIIRFWLQDNVWGSFIRITFTSMDVFLISNPLSVVWTFLEVIGGQSECASRRFKVSFWMSRKIKRSNFHDEITCLFDSHFGTKLSAI